MTDLAPLLILVALASPVSAQAPAPERMAAAACPAVSDAAMPTPLAGWTARTPVAAAATVMAAPTAALAVGRAVDVHLRRNGEVTFPVLPAKPGGSVSYGGLVGFTVTEGGDHQVSLGSGAWIEVVEGGRAVTSTAHAPGPACTTLKKTVVFPLRPGAYVLEISGNGAETLPVMITRLR